VDSGFFLGPSNSDILNQFKVTHKKRGTIMKTALRLFTVLFLLVGSRAQASGYLGGNLFYWSNETDNGTTNTRTTYMFPTLTAAYVASGGLMVGVTYNVWSKTVSSGSTTTYSNTDYGPSVGYLTSNWHVLGTYLYSAKYSIESGGTTTYGGTGMQLELGYHWSSGALMFGPSLIYSTRTYSKQTAPTEQSLSDNMKQTDMLPFLNLAYEFK